MNIKLIVASLLTSVSLLGVSSVAQNAPDGAARPEPRGPGRPRLGFSDLDVNRDGNISEDEFNQVHADRRQNRGPGERSRRPAPEAGRVSDATAAPGEAESRDAAAAPARKPLSREAAGEGAGPGVRERRREGPGPEMGGRGNGPRGERAPFQEGFAPRQRGPQSEFERGPRPGRRADGARGPGMGEFRRGPGPMNPEGPRRRMHAGDRPQPGQPEMRRHAQLRGEPREADFCPHCGKKNPGHGRGAGRGLGRPNPRG